MLLLPGSLIITSSSHTVLQKLRTTAISGPIPLCLQVPVCRLRGWGIWVLFSKETVGLKNKSLGSFELYIHCNMSHSPILVIWGLGFRVYFADYSEENRELHEPQTLQSKPGSPKPLKS